MTAARSPVRRAVRALAGAAGATLAAVVLLLIGPLAVIAQGDVTPRGAWGWASRESSGQAPDPSVERGAVVQVYGARTVGWRGAFAIHTWIATKRSDEDAYTVHHVIGWRVFRGGRAVVSQRGTPDAHWFGAYPELLADRRGEHVDALIDRLEAAVAAYPWPDTYRAWPGPNSNTFTAFVARRVPELALDLPPTAIGKDWLEAGPFARTPSGSGWQLSLLGLLGVAVGLREGMELNLLGLNVGIDVDDLVLRLPGLGRVGPWRAAEAAAATPASGSAAVPPTPAAPAPRPASP